MQKEPYSGPQSGQNAQSYMTPPEEPWLPDSNCTPVADKPERKGKMVSGVVWVLSSNRLMQNEYMTGEGLIKDEDAMGNFIVEVCRLNMV